jgi:ribosomal protein L3
MLRFGDAGLFQQEPQRAVWGQVVHACLRGGLTAASRVLPACRQVNGGSVADKVDFAYGLFEKAVDVSSVFSESEMLDTIAITRGRGTQGVVTRWGVSRLPRKTHRGLRKVSGVPCGLGWGWASF